MNNSWGSFIGGIRKPLCITSQWNYVLYLRFSLPFKKATSMSDFAKASELFGINKFEDTNKVTLGRKLLIPGVGLEPTTLGTPVRCSTNWAIRTTGHGPFPSRTLLHFLLLVRKSLYDVIEVEEYFIVTCDFTGRRLVKHIHEKRNFASQISHGMYGV